MRVTFLGTGVAVPVSNKAQSSILIEDDKVVLIDCGFGCMVRMEQAGIGPEEIDAVLITHAHSDHVGEFVGILKARWLLGAKKLRVYAPEGFDHYVEAVLESYPYLRRKLSFEVSTDKTFRIGSLRVEVREAKHSVKANAYKVEDLLVSGDTRSFPELYEDVSVTVHEMSLNFGYPAVDHTTPENFAENVSVSKAFLVHMYREAYENRGEIKRFLEKRGIEVEFPDDLQSFDL